MKGGLLADHMGLGKTLMILALITSTLDQARACKVEKHCSTSVQAWPVYSGTTLIVTPVSSAFASTSDLSLRIFDELMTAQH
jgi:SWI/SNF-related matrix-associated actin-dependent regulator of chromatin subfamily A3